MMFQDLPNLLRLDVTGSRKLGGLPDLSTAKKLEELMIESCTRLDKIPESIMVLTKLRKLNAIDCHILRGINFTVDFSGDDIQETISWRLISPRMTNRLILYNNLSIEGQIHIESYHLRGNAEHISYAFEQEIPEKIEPRRNGIRHMKSLHIKRFSYRNPPVPFRCYSFQLFPSLTELNLINLNISTIPDDINHSPLLRKINLSGNDFVCLPTTMQSLSKLKYLSLRNCPKLKSLPQLTQVETLILSDCENLQTLLRLRANEEHSTYQLLELWLDNCRSVRKLSDELTHFTKLTYLDLSRYDFVTLPSSIKDLSSLYALFVNNCKRLTSVESLPQSVKYLYAQGCDSLVNVSLSTDHALKHIDLKDCPLMKQDEQLKNLFSNDGYVQEVSFLVPNLFL
ncbi:hypothetical protein AALP_AA2G162900 [Arabis alpina]|uniref:Uncharacterized protein n=1 Tax=Arabis alpina TaxID=50452 RepID=A0A087HHV5_ARAAL|nr:hypothetical protein AALP_AA2G162900 [Arabis alpina]